MLVKEFKLDVESEEFDFELLQELKTANKPNTIINLINPPSEFKFLYVCLDVKAKPGPYFTLRCGGFEAVVVAMNASPWEFQN